MVKKAQERNLSRFVCGGGRKNPKAMYNCCVFVLKKLHHNSEHDANGVTSGGEQL